MALGRRDEVFETIGRRSVGSEARGAVRLRRPDSSNAARRLPVRTRSWPAGSDSASRPTSRSAPVREPNTICTSSSKLNSQNGRFQIFRPDHICAAVEAVGIFVVGVDQENAQIASRLHDLAQDERERARFSGPGGTENGEMLAHHLVDIDGGGDRGVLLQAAELDRARTGQIEYRLQFVGADADNGAANLRIDGRHRSENVFRRLRLSRQEDRCARSRRQPLHLPLRLGE